MEHSIEGLEQIQRIVGLVCNMLQNVVLTSLSVTLTLGYTPFPASLFICRTKSINARKGAGTSRRPE